MTEVLVIIVSYNSVNDIGRCFVALSASAFTQFRVIVNENGGSEAYAALRQALPAQLIGGQRVEIVRAPSNLGYAGGINFALRHAQPADAYWILNPDAEPGPDALADLVERLEQGDCGAVGHDLVLPSGKLASRAGGQWRAWSARAISIDHGSDPGLSVGAAVLEAKLDYLVGASILVSQGFLDRVGHMREDYFLYCEEIEWCLRAKLLGEKLGYAQDAEVLHRHGTSTGGGGALKYRSKLAVYLNARNRILLTRDRFPKLLPAALVLSAFHIILISCRAGAWRQLMFGLSGWWAGVKNERDRPVWWTEAN